MSFESVRVTAAVVLLAAVFGVTLVVGARIGPFAALLGVAPLNSFVLPGGKPGAAYLAMRIREKQQ